MAVRFFGGTDHYDHFPGIEMFRLLMNKSSTSRWFFENHPIGEHLMVN